MTDLLAVADKLKGLAAAVPGVKGAYLGVNDAFPVTPAAEIIIGDGRLQTLAAGQHVQLETMQVSVVFYTPLFRSLERDERELIPLVKTFVETITAENFDFTLGDLVEDIRPIGFSFDVVVRNNKQPYRYAAVDLRLGDLGDDV